MECNDIVIGLAGSGGDGVVTAGEILVNAAASQGLYSIMLKSFGPQIRGGESSCRVRICEQQFYSHGDRVQVLGVFSWKDYMHFRQEMMFTDPVIIIEDSDDKSAGESPPVDQNVEQIVYSVPLGKLAKEKAGTTLAKNMVMLGVLSELFNFPGDEIRHAIQDQFARKKREVTESNLAGFAAGIEYVKTQLQKQDNITARYTRSEPKVVMDGNTAMAYGALHAGCRFFAGYPITPSSEIMEWMSGELPRYGGTMIQAEDELAAIGMVIGASFAGEKAMTATSGP
ncbi:MAG TPA: 2-oxoacid:acceptor oxidoreductase family protein, partial [bacterium]|nr:2-oxoacid:acceptor oxidoreductase family protein [bacterium]